MTRHLRALAGLLLLSATGLGGQTPPVTPRSATLLPGDLVRVEIWREEDLSGEFLVDEDGTLTLPLLGPRSVSGIPLHELRQTLLSEYRVHLRNPSITVTPLRRIYVLGEVNAPGLHAVDPTVSLAGAIALAGGANPQGDIRRIRVIRDGQVVLSGVAAETALNAVDVRSGDQIFVDRRSWFERNTTFLISAMLSVASIVITLAR